MSVIDEVLGLHEPLRAPDGVVSSLPRGSLTLRFPSSPAMSPFA